MLADQGASTLSTTTWIFTAVAGGIVALYFARYLLSRSARFWVPDGASPFVGHLPILLEHWKDANVTKLLSEWERQSPTGNFTISVLGAEQHYINRPTTVAHLFKAAGFAKKPWPYDIFSILGAKSQASMVHPTDEREHKHVRSALMPFFHTDNMSRVFKQLHPLSERLAQDLAARCQGGESVDVVTTIQRLIVNVVFDVFYELGADVDLGVPRTDYPLLVRDIYTLGPKLMSTPFGVSRVLRAPWSLPHLAQEWQGVWSKFRLAHKRVIEAKWSGPEPEPDNKALWACLRRAFPDAMHEGSPDHELLIANVGVLFFASFETTSMGIAGALAALSLVPHAARALEQELQAAGLLVVPGQRTEPKPLTFSDLSRLHYLDAVVHETLRLFPPAPHGGSRVLRQDVQIDGLSFRKGTQFTVETFPVHVSEKVWGPDAREFRPERWLEHEGGISGCKKDESGATRWVPFLSGPQNCVGQHLALMEIKLTLAVLLGRLRVECDAAKCGFGDIAGMVDALRAVIALDFKDGIWLSFAARNASSDPTRD